MSACRWGGRVRFAIFIIIPVSTAAGTGWLFVTSLHLFVERALGQQVLGGATMIAHFRPLRGCGNQRFHLLLAGGRLVATKHTAIVAPEKKIVGLDEDYQLLFFENQRRYYFSYIFSRPRAVKFIAQ